VLGIDLGGTNLRAAVAERTGAIVSRMEEPIDSAAGPAAIRARIVALAERALDAFPGGPLRAVALASPGLVDGENGVVLLASNLRDWADVPLRDWLTTDLGAPAAVENDVNLAVLGERWHGAARGCDDAVFVAVGTGVGAGILVGGRLVRGHGFAAGEIGALPSGFPAEAGGDEARIEDIAAGPAIVRRARALGIAAPHGPLTTTKVFALARAGDQRAAAVLDQAVTALARGLAAVIASVDPEVIVVGGGVSRQGDALLGPLRARLDRLMRLRVRLVLSELGTDAQLHGAVCAALRLAGARTRQALWNKGGR
jgi:glucokinase